MVVRDPGRTRAEIAWAYARLTGRTHNAGYQLIDKLVVSRKITPVSMLKRGGGDPDSAYRVSERGLASHRAWMSGALAASRPLHDDFELRLKLARPEDFPALLDGVTSRLRASTAALHEHRRRRLLPSSPRPSWQTTADSLCRHRARLDLQVEVTWLTDVARALRRAIEDLDQAPAP